MALSVAPIQDIEDLRAAVNDGSRHVQKTYFTFLLVSIYIAIIIVSTTHEQLLRGRDVTPPFLSVGMAIVWFYFIFPCLFLPLHLNLIIQYYLLSQKIHEMNKIDPNTDKPGSGLLFHTSLFTQSMIGTFRDGTRKVFFEPLVYYSSAVLPILLLFFGLIKFLPYHSEPITWLHRVSISLDLIMVWFFWVKIIQEEGQLKIWWDDFWGRISPEKSKMGRSNRAAAAVNFFLSLLLILFSVLVTTIPDESQSIEPVSQYFEDNWSWFTRNLDLHEKTLVEKEPPPEIIAALIPESGGDEAKATQKACSNKELVTGLNLQRRDLRYADFYRAKLPFADLRGANLQQANLREAQLQGSNLRRARMQGADLRSTRMQGVNLGGRGCRARTCGGQRCREWI